MTSSGETLADVPASALRARASQAYGQQTRQSLEERLILDHLPLVRHVVSKITAQLGRKVDTDDMLSAGTLGLVKAARAFDASRHAEFKTYAYIRIRGSVIDELRGRSFAPSGSHRQLRLIREAYSRLTNSLGHSPNDEELATEMGIPLSQLYRSMEQARKQHFLSIHGLSDGESPLGAFIPADGEPSPQAHLERKEMLESLSRAILDLPQRDRTILLLYYERDLTMKEAAVVLGVTESRVSQLHAAALFKLSMKLKPA